MKPYFVLGALLATASARAGIVTNTLNSGPGSLRQVFLDHLRSDTGPITFAPELSGQTIMLNGELYIGETFDVHPIATSTVVIDATSLPGGITINGGGSNFFRAPSGTSLTLRGLTFTGGAGSGTGAVRSLGTLEVSGCTFTNNSGTVVSTEMGTGTITRCTFAGNSGTAVSNPYTGFVVLTHCTVSANDIGLSNGYRYSVMKVVNCIIAGNTTLDVSNSHTFILEGANIIQTATPANPGDPIGNPYPSTYSGPPAITSAPLLAPLDNHGGPAKTMALLPGSPARNAAVGSTSATDQRGFPIVGIPDIGAFEAAPPPGYDTWALQAFPAAATPADRAEDHDYDGDGQSNGHEFIFLTDPVSASSFFALQTAVQGGSLHLSFPSASGRTYILQQTSDPAAAWTNATAQNPINGDGSSKSFVIPASAARQFFRVVGSL
jgi:hypothetical protein